MIGGDESFGDVNTKVLEHNHLSVEVDLVNRHLDHIPTVLGDLKKSPLDVQLQSLKSKEKGDREFLEEIAYLQSMTNLVSWLDKSPKGWFTSF